MLDFKISDRVTFQPEARPPLVGMLTRYNKTPVTVIADNGQHWNVSPGLLRKAAPIDSTNTGNAKVILSGKNEFVCKVDDYWGLDYSPDRSSVALNTDKPE